MEDDGGDWSAGRGDNFTDIVGDDAQLHSGRDVSAAFDEGIPDARAIGEDVHQFFNPNGIFDGTRVAREHLQGAHGAEGAVDEEGDVVGVDGASVAGFDDDGRFSMDRGGVVEVAGGHEVGGAFAPDDDVIETEGEDHFLGGAVLGFAAGGPPVGVGAEAFVEVATVVVDEVVAAVDDFPGDEERGALGLRAIGFAGVETVHAFVVDGIDVRDFLLEGLDIDERDENDGASHLRGVEIGDEFLDGDDGDVFGAVGTGDECENFAGLCPVYDDDGDAGGGVDTSGNFQDAGGFLVGDGRSGADSEGGLGMRQKRSEQ